MLGSWGRGGVVMGCLVGVCRCNSIDRVAKLWLFN